MLKVLNKNIVFLFCLLFFSSLFKGKAQDIPASIKLKTYLLQVEKKFNVKFSYLDSDIEKITITPLQNTTLSSILEEIEANTQLQIKKISERYYAISKSDYVAICGQFFGNNKNALLGAQVDVLDYEITTTTDAEGNFRLAKVPKDAIIRVKYPEYRTRFITVRELENKNPCSVYLMVPLYNQLEEVVLYKFLTTGLTKGSDASIVLNTSTFGILPGLIEPDVLQTVQALPGIKSIDETVSDINIRGGTNDQNLVLWDGIKMYQSGHFFGLISAFNPYLTDNVAIIKNGTSAQYGDGVSGVLDMRTKNTVNDSFFGGAGLNMVSADFYGQLPISHNMAFQFSARRSLTDFVATPTYNQFFEKAFQDSNIKNGSSPSNREIERRADFYFYDFSAKLLYDIRPNQKLRFSFININNTLDYQEEFMQTGNTTFSSLDQRNTSFGGVLESVWNPSFSTTVNAYYTRYNLEALNVANAVQQLFQNNKVEETGFKIQSNYHFSDQLQWSNGYQLNEVGIINLADVTQPPYRSNIKGVIRTNALFSEIGFNNDKINARGGLRLNYIENLDTFKKWIIEPRLNVNYGFNDFFKLDVLAEFKSQSTNQVIDLEQNFLGVEKKRWILADEEMLPVTTSKQASVGFNYDKRTLYIGLEGFYKQVNGVSTETQGFQNQNQFNGEIGKYSVHGAEFLINKKTATYSTWLSYTYNNNTYTFADIQPNKFPNNLDIRHTVTFAGTYNYKKIKFGVGFNYRSGKPYTKPQRSNSINTINFPNAINYESPNSSRLPDYLRADASALYNFPINDGIKATLGISILNILDKKNILDTYYKLSPTNEIETVERVSLGVTPNASFRLQF